MIRARHFYSLFIYLLLSGFGCTYTHNYFIDPKYEGYLGPAGILPAVFRADSGRGDTIALPLQTTAQLNGGEKGEGCVYPQHEENVSQAQTGFTASVPGLPETTFSAENKSFILSGKISEDVNGRRTERARTNISLSGPIRWATSKPLANYSSGLILDSASSFVQMSPMPGQPAEPILTVKTTLAPPPANPQPGATYYAVILVHEARFSRNYGLIYLHYYYYDAQGAPHEERLLRTQ